MIEIYSYQLRVESFLAVYLVTWEFCENKTHHKSSLWLDIHSSTKAVILLLVIIPISVIFISDTKLTQALSEDPDRSIHPCTKAVQDSQVMWNKEKGLFTGYLWRHYVLGYFRGVTGTRPAPDTSGSRFKKPHPRYPTGLSAWVLNLGLTVYFIFTVPVLMQVQSICGEPAQQIPDRFSVLLLDPKLIYPSNFLIDSCISRAFNIA